MNSYSRGFRNAFRNKIRTISVIFILGLSIGLAISLVVARQAVTKKISDVKGNIGNVITISPAGARGFDGGGEPLNVDSVAKVKSTAHVVSVTSTLSDRLAEADTSLKSAIDVNNIGRRQRPDSAVADPNAPARPAVNFAPPVFVNGFDDQAVIEALLGGALKLTSGTAFDPKSESLEAIMGQDLATKNALTVGSTFQAYGKDVKLVGIFDAGTGNRFASNIVAMPLKTLQTLSSQPTSLSSAVAKVDNIDNMSTTLETIKTALGTSADVVSQVDSSNQAISPLESIKSVSLYSLVGAVAAGAVIILLTMVMIVRERRREIGVLKAIGASGSSIMKQFVSEAVTFTLIACVIGIVLGVVASGPITKVLVNNGTSSNQVSQQGVPGQRGGPGRLLQNTGLSTTNIKNVKAVVDGRIIGYGLLAALLIAVLGSAVPAFLISKISPAEVLRAE
jgi:putative ABC transport system permease protein